MTIGYLERMKESFLNQVLYFQCEVKSLEGAEKFVSEYRGILDGFIEHIKAQEYCKKLRKVDK